MFRLFQIFFIFILPCFLPHQSILITSEWLISLLKGIYKVLINELRETKVILVYIKTQIYNIILLLTHCASPNWLNFKILYTAVNNKLISQYFHTLWKTLENDKKIPHLLRWVHLNFPGMSEKKNDSKTNRKLL